MGDIFNSEHLSGGVDWVIRFDVLSLQGVIGPIGSAAVATCSDGPTIASRVHVPRNPQHTGTEFDRNGDVMTEDVGAYHARGRGGVAAPRGALRMYIPLILTGSAFPRAPRRNLCQLETLSYDDRVLMAQAFATRPKVNGTQSLGPNSKRV